jgi:D-alanyl-D-alanine carboxypeptidase
VRTLCRLDEVGLGCTWWERLEPQPEPAPPRLAPLFVGDADLGGADCSLDLWGGGGLVSTTTDLARWWRALFGGAVFDHQETLATMTGGLVPSSEGHGLAGLGLFRRRCGGRDWWGHTGYWGSAAMLDPDRDVTVAIFRNQATSPFEDLDPVVASLVAAA